MRIRKATSLTYTVAATLMLAAGTATPADAAGVRFECRDQLARQDVSTKARFERKGNRRKFTVEIEAARSSSFRAGDILKVRVDDAAGIARVVGQVKLVRGPKDFVGDLNLDTVPQADSKPFPGNFPSSVGAGTEVQVGAQLACALQAR